MPGFTPSYTFSGITIRDSRDSNATACDNAICDWSASGYRLPTEGEWQYAASYIDGIYWTPYSYASGAVENTSDAISVVAWYVANSGGKTQNVGLKESNQLSAYDMSGNVWEWCWDWQGTYPSTSTDYRGPSSGTKRITRGGDWHVSGEYLQIGYRLDSIPQYGDDYMGLRVTRSE